MDYETYENALRVDCVLFAGDYHKALVLIRQTKRTYERSKVRFPRIILSDWSADPALPKIGGEDIEGVYLTHPRSAAEIGNDDIGYRHYGRDTAWILKKLIVETNKILSQQTGLSTTLKDWLKMRSVGDVRQALAQAMSRLRGFEGTPSREKYDFDLKKDGHLTGGQFHVWVVKAGKYEEVPFVR